ncbi:hypothetical protein [Persicobacter diffluens]|uniref:Uncharacterized protein n=1 Tax=Persicobacter diffluens TaxID=981 RepID=A0AAN5AMG2_9BACT|nr:hypothetical protein PEDI_56020 [Persicobacter diffluens]
MNYSNNFNIKYLALFAAVLVSLCNCTQEEPPLNYEPPFTFVPKDSSEFNGARAQTTIKIHAEDAVPISPYLLGVNNDWSVISSESFSKFTDVLGQIGSQNLRFPGGWESEFYDWKLNDTPDWNSRPDVQGASIEQVLAANPKSLSIVVPTVKAMDATLQSDAWDEALDYCKSVAKEAITKCSPEKIMTLEIGNEWWLQYAGGKTRAKKLENYAHIAREIAIYIDQEFPNAPFKVLVNGDFVHPEEFTKIKEVFGADLDLIDGCALHPYAGYNPPANSPNHQINMLVELIHGCRDNLGKPYVHLSEWAPSKDYNDHKMYAEGANVMMEQVYEFGRTGADAGAFWPPLNTSIVGLGLFSANFATLYPTAQMFSELAHNFKGESLKVTDGPINEYGEVMRAIASREDKKVVVYVVGNNHRWSRVDLQLEGMSINEIKAHQLFVPGSVDTALPLPMETVKQADYAITDNTLTFYINENRPYCIYKFEIEID